MFLGHIMLAFLARTRYTAGAFWIGIGVASHWVLDWIVHKPDLQLVPWAFWIDRTREARVAAA